MENNECGFVVVQEGLPGDCAFTMDLDQAVGLAFKHRGDCAVVVVCADTGRAEKRTIQLDAGEDEIRGRLMNGVEFAQAAWLTEPLR